MKNCFKRALTFLMAAGMLLTATACEDRTGPYVSRPQDSMLIYQKEEGVFLTNTDAAAYTAEGASAGSLNADIVPLASGSAYYIEDGELYFKSYLEPAYKMTGGVNIVFYSLGSVFALTEDGKLLRTDDKNGYEVVLENVKGASPGGRAFVECANTVYVTTEDGTLYRLFFGGAPEKMQIFKEIPVFLTGNGEDIYFAADGAVWKCGHKAVAPKRVSGKQTVTSIVPEHPVSYAEKLFWQEESGELFVYNVEKGKAESAGWNPGEVLITGKLLPENTSDAEALILTTDQGENFAYLFDEEEIVPIPEAYWCYADGEYLYGITEEGMLIYDGENEKVTEMTTPHSMLATPYGYYFLTGETEGYQATLWALHDGEAEKIAENVFGSRSPNAVYKYGGISYFTDKAIYIMDEETRVSEVFAECEGVVDFIPRAGGAYALFEDGRLDVMIYGDELSETVDEGVTHLFPDDYNMPERLTTYPN